MSHTPTETDIAALVEDREAGTQGPWRVRVNKRDDQYTCDVSICGDIFVLADLNGPQYVHQHANARRIARVPDMEAALIAQDAELKRLRMSVSAQEDRIDALIVLLAETLPWVEAQIDDPSYKPGTVRAVANRIRAALGEKQ